MINNKKNTFVLLSLLYIISNILLLFVHGIFWDDWTLYHNSNAIEKQFFQGNGAIILGYIHLFFQELACNTILLYRLIIFFIGWACVLLSYKILSSSFNINTSTSFYITAIYATFPLGYAHMTMICLPYQIGLLLQLTAILLFTSNKHKNNIDTYLLFFLIQFGASLFLMSTIAFWGGLLFIFALQTTWEKSNLTLQYAIVVLRQLIKWFIYYIPCIVFWIIRNVYFMPTGVYKADGYNSFSLYKFALTPINLIKSLINSLYFTTTQIPDILNSKLFIIIGLILFILITYILKSNTYINDSSKTTKKHFLTISLLYFFAIAAYVAVGLVQTFNSVSDRHAILIILTICPFIYYSIEIIVKPEFKKYVLILILSTLSTYSFSQYWEAIYQSQRNDAIKLFFSETILPKGNIFVNEEEVNTKTGSCFYSWSAIYYHATGKQDRCFATSNNTKFYYTKDFLTEVYHQKDANIGKPTIQINMINEIESRSNIATLKRLFNYYYQPTKYKYAIKSDFNIQYIEYNNIVE